MAASVHDIRRWLEKLYADPNLTHMIVATDTFDYEDYPRYVTRDEKVKVIERYLENQPMTRVMEVYSKSVPMDVQLAQHRVFNYE